MPTLERMILNFKFKPYLSKINEIIQLHKLKFNIQITTFLQFFKIYVSIFQTYDYLRKNIILVKKKLSVDYQYQQHYITYDHQNRGSDKFGPVKRLPKLCESFTLLQYLFLVKLLSSFHLMSLKTQCSRQHLIAKLSLPKFLILYDMGISKAIREINIKIFDRPRYLLLQPTLFLLYLYYILMRIPVTLHILQGLFEEKRHILSLIVTNHQTLNINMTVVLTKLLKKYYSCIDLIKSLQQTLFKVTYFCENVFIQTDHRLLVINRCQNKVVIVFEGFPLSKGQVYVV